MKYIIELEDKPFISEHGEELYRAKGFKSLVFDQSGMTRYECAVNIDCLSLYPMCGIGFGLLPLDYEEVDRIVKQMVQDEIGMDIDSVNL